MSKETFTKRYRLPYTHDLPSEWNYVEIGKVFKESNENNRPDLPLYSVTRTKGIIPQEENNKRDTSSSDKSKYKVIHPGDIVYNTMRMWQGVVALSNVEGIVSPAYTVCTPTEDVYGKYAEYLFKTHPMIKLFHRFSQGLVDDTLSLKYENFKKIFMPLPPFSEQRKIAAILSSVDEAIEKTEAIIEQTEKVKKGLMQQLLTKGIGHTKFKKTEIGEIPEGWESKRVGDLVKFEGGSQPPRSTFIFEPKEGYIRLLQIRDYKTDKYATYIPIELAKRFCNEDDVMIGRYGPPIFQIFRGLKGAYNVALIKAIPNENYVTKDYLYYFLKQEPLFKLIDSLSQRTSGQTGIDMDALKNYGFPLPPISEQKKITAILDNVQAKIDKENDYLQQLQIIKKGLMQSLLTGKVRVKVDEDEVVSS